MTGGPAGYRGRGFASGISDLRFERGAADEGAKAAKWTRLTFHAAASSLRLLRRSRLGWRPTGSDRNSMHALTPRYSRGIGSAHAAAPDLLDRHRHPSPIRRSGDERRTELHHLRAGL